MGDDWIGEEAVDAWMGVVMVVLLALVLVACGVGIGWILWG
ncbi:hypothetical protein [Ralstonia sp.]